MLLAASDDQGRGQADPDVIKWYVCPNVAEIAQEDIPTLLEEMQTQGMIILYGDPGEQLYQVVNWWEYQKMQWAHASKYPPPTGWIDKERRRRKADILIDWYSWRKTRARILKRDNFTCGYCSKPANTVDHIIPRLHGGTDEPGNLVAACKSCNSRKWARTPEEAGMELKNV